MLPNHAELGWDDCKRDENKNTNGHEVIAGISNLVYNIIFSIIVTLLDTGISVEPYELTKSDDNVL